MQSDIPERNRCPKCGNGMAVYMSRNEKVCHDCKITIPWYLEPKQKPLVQHTR